MKRTNESRVVGRSIVGAAAAAAIGAIMCNKSPPSPAPSTEPPASSASSAAASAPPASAATTAEATPSATALATASAATSAAAAGSSVDAGKGKTAAAGLKPASTRIAGSNFSLDVASPGCKSGDECAMTVKLLPAGEYHVNKEYPYKFIATPTAGVTFLGKSDANIFSKAAGDYVEQGAKAATLTVRFKPSAPGEAHVSGKYKLSVCSAAQCQIEEQAVDLAVPVM